MGITIHIKGKAKIPEGTLSDNIPRPEHPDFMTSKELKDIKFTGMRHNTLLDRIEIWVLGGVVADSRVGDVPALARNYCRIFKMESVTFYSSVAPGLNSSYVTPPKRKGDKE